MLKQLLVLFFSTFVINVFAQNNPLWLRYPAISPDGKWIVFGYKGNLYKVSSDGGNAVALTLNESQNQMPVWSHDGKHIAFASDRYGNFDVYIMPSEGGEATRLTFNSANDFPWDFSIDNKQVIFGSGRNDLNTSVRFPNKGLFQKLYQVPVSGCRSILLLTAGTENVHYNSKGDAIVFQDRKGYEDAWRKHHTSSVTRDIWIYDFKTKEYRKISGFEGEDREPVFSADNQFIYYLSEKNGTQNIYKIPVLNKMAEQQLTNFKNNPVRHLSRANDNTLCFSWDGEIYTLKEDGKPEKVSIVINTDSKLNTEKIVPIYGGATEMSVSPNGKEIAFIFRGEVFVTSVDGGITKRITNTPQQERMVTFAPDGKTLYYAAERNGSWDILKATINRKEEPYFYTSTIIKEEPVIATEKEEFQPIVSPDGKEIAYLEERNIVKIFNIEKKTSRTILPAGQNFSYSDGDQSFEWSPDGKWLAIKSAKGNFSQQSILVFKADGSDTKGTDIINSGFGGDEQQWAFGGKAILYTSEKYGKKPLAVQGTSESDIMIEFFDKDLYDRFKLNKYDAELLKEKEDKEKKDTSKKKEEIVLDFNNLEERRIRLTNGSLNLSGYALSLDGSKLFYLAKFEQGFDLWQLDTRTKEIKIVAKLNAGGGGMELSKDGKNLFVIADGRLTKIEVDAGRVSPVMINGEMVLNTAGERAYIFEHVWRQVKKKFYDTKLHSVDWDMYKKTYQKFLPHINNNYDFQELLSEILGELNASHTGGRYSPQNPNGDITASLGLFYDETIGGKGLKITEVIANGPVDKAKSKIKAGTIIEKIDGEEITDAVDWNKFLNRKIGKNVLLSLNNGTEKWEEVIKPISGGEENFLLYKRWTKTMADMVDKLSGGKVGYVHVQGMNDGAYRDVFERVLGENLNKEALIVDTRFNGGGWLHDDLVTFLKGKQYLTFAPYGFKSGGGEPLNKWTKPSVVLMSESNYSDAFIFPYAYRANGVGKLIGKPVPGTGTAVWWETQIDPTIVFGIPMIATIGAEKRPTENLQINPDIDVTDPYNNVLFGKDDQLEAAVKEMLKTVGGK
ncbi:MAG: PD40 domain-containing protein [Bacteroidetes bacterium]|nr:PD40 domain-containing protein [Bacteroidota bacterium]MBS1648403.1 PD40 domain-containing protein [Bacteroidota bacterium]